MFLDSEFSWAKTRSRPRSITKQSKQVDNPNRNNKTKKNKQNPIVFSTCRVIVKKKGKEQTKFGIFFKQKNSSSLNSNLKQIVRISMFCLHFVHHCSKFSSVTNSDFQREITEKQPNSTLIIGKQSIGFNRLNEPPIFTIRDEFLVYFSFSNSDAENNGRI